MLEEVIDRLSDKAMPPLKLVEGAAALKALADAPPKHLQPAAWAIPVEERGSANQAATGISQRIAARFGVFLALGDFSDRRGEAGAQTLETIVAAVRDALVGWQPTADHTAVTFARGRTLDIRNRVLLRLEEFECAYWQRSF